MTVLTADRLHASLDGRKILSNVSFLCDGGAFIGLLGPNGAGKSTLLKILARLLKPTAGRVLIDRSPAAFMKAQEYARTIAYLPQERVIHWPVNVETIVRLGRLPHRTFLNGAARMDDVIISDAMRATEVEHLRRRIATKLSGGEQARVLLARVLAQQAAIILADEPTSALDPAHQISVMETLSALSERGSIVIAAVHDLNLAGRWCDRLLVLKEGAVAADGSPKDVLSPELMRDVYEVDGTITHESGRPVVIPTALVRNLGVSR